MRRDVCMCVKYLRRKRARKREINWSQIVDLSNGSESTAYCLETFEYSDPGLNRHLLLAYDSS